jgi:hypothetical protein
VSCQGYEFNIPLVLSQNMSILIMLILNLNSSLNKNCDFIFHSTSMGLYQRVKSIAETCQYEYLYVKGP